MIKKLIVTPFLKLLGVNAEHFYSLYSMKMKMDFRRTPSGMQAGGKKQTFGKQILMYGVVGLVMLPLLFAVQDPKVSFSILFAMIMVMTGSTMLVEFTSVLFDENENYILLPRPISSRTLLFTRLAHIMTYISIITYSLSLPASIFILIKFGIAFFPFLIGVFLASLFTLLVVVGFYMSMAQLVNGERFKDIINYFQIGLTVIILGGYQILPRIFDIEGVGNMSLEMHWWVYLIPPVWFAGFTDLFISGMQLSGVILALTAIVASIFGAFVVVRLLANGFDVVLSQHSEVNTKNKKTKRIEGESKGFLEWWSKIVCVSSMERQGWNFANNVTKRDRKFKQQVYPMIAYAIILSVVMLMPDFKNLNNFWQEIAESKKYLAFIFIGFMCVVSASILPYTDSPEASWIYKIAKPKNTNHIHSGALKLIIFKFFTPIYLFLICFTFYVWGIQEAIYIVAGALLTVLWTVFGITLQKQPLPFSVHRDMLKKGGYTGRMIISMIITGVIIGLVFGVTLLPYWVSYAVIAVVSVFISLAYSKIRNKRQIPNKVLF
ncbi:hypothetical protein [Carboxylicivirga linearis]|uniref:ABC transporter permease n=1 Tax=Carboxylicivirga linearis TaxID=1628157 RepID=A0ABS5JT01_9BACT|nr:hypothetical protein [Carboxylicivirga linearis]MBS2097659.1 hypothetical protein [Carboxylicivirga linearis]